MVSRYHYTGVGAVSSASGVFVCSDSTANGSSMEGAMSVGDPFFAVVDPSRKEKNEYISAEPLLKKVRECTTSWHNWTEGQRDGKINRN